ncbi:hypothetical protein Kpol_1004p70 [Vanderwaltozyma polyspora DSM 70294]|uniref:sphinganine-1-phosphate aldolase n=1 Tax=Vanderwaltozyma polyspora (strain ATCC 22028 / DSM 70294 / BCRC 21397 / CBS 2163 / NBRC 10782 / NRRL Y-8283 / UCD 57-17) TaxID=436907 RepID=A7TJC3_VANPO|nr:uncharacterized protein Kpol_1004p70 [Vanderwaltozyma polyspora DSM 70294]EDO17692.1 hypothetical protein Kpol_1004p70 [Vanderwaltozyma polyspora DSM 70294]
MGSHAFVETVNSIDLSDPIGFISSHVNYYIHTRSWLDILRDYLLVSFCYKFLNLSLFYIRAYGFVGAANNVVIHLMRKLFGFLLNSFILKGSVDKEINSALLSIEKELIKNDDVLQDYETLPLNGIPEYEILKELDDLNEILPSSPWREGKVSGAVYHGGEDLIRLQAKAYEKYCVANQLHPDVFPAVRKMESEVISMVLNMFHAPKDTGCGTTTSGGTESLLLACLSAKMYAYHNHGITEPEMIIPVTAHAGFDKASYYFGIKAHHVQLDPVTYKVDLKQVERLINGNTVLLVGSAPNFPHGIIDDIEGLGKLAQGYRIPLHVDCCLGSFVAAFMEKAGFDDAPLFDFRIPGVTSISCDTHKYGFAPKGSSIIMYRNNELRMNQYYISSDWVGGLYGSPTLAGSRPGALVVGCWATMINIGENGYIKSCKEIVSAARKLRKYIENELPELQIIGNPQCSVTAFKSDVIDVYELSDKLAKEGWHLSTLQKPAALHLAVTKLSINSVDELCTVLKRNIEEMKESNSTPASDGTSALYGIAGSIKTTGVADKLVVGFIDSLFKLKPTETQDHDKDHYQEIVQEQE